MTDLWGQVKAGAGWVGMAGIVGRATSWVATLIIAGSLGPSRFGLITLGWAASFALASLRDQAAAVAVIGGSGDDEGHRAWWWLTVGASIVGAATLVAFANPVEIWTGEDATSLFSAFAASLVVSGLSAIPSGTLQRRLDFRPLALAEVASVTVYSLVATGGVLMGMGAMSVGVGQLVGATLGTTAIFYVSRFNPLGQVSWAAIRREATAVGATVVWTAAALAFINADTVVVATRLGGPSVGRYSLAFNVACVATVSLAVVTTKVIFPAHRMTDRTSGGQLYLATQRTVLAIAVPLTLALVTAGPAVFRLAFGPQYEAAAGVVSILAVYGLGTAIAAAPNSVLRAARKHWFVATVMAGQTVLALVLLMSSVDDYGLVGAGLSVTVAMAIGAAALLRGVGRDLGTSWRALGSTLPSWTIWVRFVPALFAGLLLHHDGLAIAFATAGGISCWQTIRRALRGANLTAAPDANPNLGTVPWHQ